MTLDNLHRILLDNSVRFYESHLYVDSQSLSQKVHALVDDWMEKNRLAYMPDENFLTDSEKKYVLGTMRFTSVDMFNISEFHRTYPQTKSDLREYAESGGGCVLTMRVLFPTPFENCATKERFGDADANSVAFSLAGYYS
jgi:hypothetical protein